MSASLPPGSVVGSVRPVDPALDLAGSWFSVLAGNPDNVFAVDSYSGDVILVKPLTSGKEFNLKVALNDNTVGMSREVLRVKILVTEGEEGSPVFSSSPLEIRVAENTAIGTPIQAITAKGSDGNGTIRYSLLDQFPETFFRIDTLSGELFLVQELDYETTEKVFMTLRATDSPYVESGRRTSNVAVIVHVEDTNDHAPTFVSTNKKEMQQGTDTGVPFHRVLAVDGDSGEAGIVRYQIEGGNSDNVFQLDPSTGLLSVRERPRRKSYRLAIKAEDNGTPRKSGSQMLSITVVEQINGPPKFSQSVYRAEVAENSGPGSVVTTVQADKQDAGADILYSLDAQVSMELFGIDERSGEIVTKGKLDREERGEYIVTVYVHDSATQPSFDTATVLINS